MPGNDIISVVERIDTGLRSFKSELQQDKGVRSTRLARLVNIGLKKTRDCEDRPKLVMFNAVTRHCAPVKGTNSEMDFVEQHKDFTKGFKG